MNEITIENGIPLPPTKRVGNRWGRGAKWAQAIRSMEIGDSMVVPADRLPGIYKACKRNGWKLRTQTQPDREVGKLANVRLWLIAKESN